jgi:hypothetical protein
MENSLDIIIKLHKSIEMLEQEIEILIEDNRVKTIQLKKLYKDNDMLKKKYRVFLSKISGYVDDLELLKKNYGKN